MLFNGTSNSAGLSNRVYKGEWAISVFLALRLPTLFPVKQEIFLTDVTTCFNALKKAVQDLTLASVNPAQLQMGQPSLR